MARGRDPRRAARARALRARASSSTARCSTARSRGWRMLAAEALRHRHARRAAASSAWPARSSATGPIACADGYVTLGALEPKFWQAFCRGRRPRGPARPRLRPARLRRARARCARSSASARASSGGRSPPSTTAAWSRCWSSTRRSSPSWWRRGRWWSSSTSPGAERPVKLLGVPVKLSRHPGRPGPRARARRWASTPTRCWPRPATRADEIAALHASGASPAPAETVRGSFISS